MDDQAHHCPLQREVLPGGAGIVQVDRVRCPRVREVFVSQHHDEHRRLLAPALIARGEQLKEGRPVFRSVAGEQEAPLLLVAGRGGPAGGLEQSHQFGIGDRLAAHRPWRPALQEEGLDRVVRLADRQGIGMLSHVQINSRRFLRVWRAGSDGLLASPSDPG